MENLYSLALIILSKADYSYYYTHRVDTSMVIFNILNIFITIALTYFLFWILEKICKKRLIQTKTVEQAVLIRKIFITLRWLIIITYTIGIVLEFGSLARASDDANIRLGGIILWIIVVLIISVYPSLSMPISGTTFDRLISKKKGFVLYLRGFSTDNYKNYHQANFFERAKSVWSFKKKESIFDETEYEILDNKDAWGIGGNKIIDKPFSEYNLAKAWKYSKKIWRNSKKVKLYCVGMTKELESPVGCKRIYIDDTTWQDNVTELIKRASRIFVLVNTSESCLWEIKQCEQYAKDRTIYILHDEKILEKVHALMKKDTPQIFLRHLDDNSITKHILLYEKSGKDTIYNYTNTYLGHTIMLSNIM